MSEIFGRMVLLFTMTLHLVDVDGMEHTQREWADAKAVVLFFITTDCPLSNALTPELNRLQGEYSRRGVRFYAVQADSTVPEEQVRQHAKDFALRFPVLLDPKQSLAHQTGATVTPEVAVLSAHGKLLYRGRVDNRVERIGVSRFQPTSFELRDALEAILNGRAVAQPVTQAVGCAITSFP